MRRFVHAIFTLLVAVLLGSGWYVYHKGFTRKWRSFVSEEFRKRGIELTLRKLTLDPLRGVVAEEVKVFDGHDRKRTLAVIDDMRLVINWANLIRGKTFLDALDLRDARLSLPLDPKDFRGPKIDITRLSGRLMLPPEQIYLRNLEAELYGIRVTSSGRLVNPQYVTTALRNGDQSARNSSATCTAASSTPPGLLRRSSTSPRGRESRSRRTRARPEAKSIAVVSLKVVMRAYR